MVGSSLWQAQKRCHPAPRQLELGPLAVKNFLPPFLVHFDFGFNF
jgi:hypothetical protein